MAEAKPRKMTFGMVVGNRGFFPGHLAESGRAEMIAAIEKAGHSVVALGLEAARHGAVESRAEAAACADLFRNVRRAVLSRRRRRHHEKTLGPRPSRSQGPVGWLVPGKRSCC